MIQIREILALPVAQVTHCLAIPNLFDFLKHLFSIAVIGERDTWHLAMLKKVDQHVKHGNDVVSTRCREEI